LPLKDDGGFESKLHEKYAGKIVFATKPIAMKEEDDSIFVKSVTLKDPLFMRFYGDGSPANVLRKKGVQCDRSLLYYGASVNDGEETILVRDNLDAGSIEKLTTGVLTE